MQSEFTVLPATQDKWVSLHPSFGLVCWCDDDILKKEFKHSDNIEFLYFGELTNNEKEMVQTKVSLLLQNLGIRALSEVCISTVLRRHQHLCLPVPLTCICEMKFGIAPKTEYLPSYVLGITKVLTVFYIRIPSLISISHIPSFWSTAEKRFD